MDAKLPWYKTSKGRETNARARKRWLQTPKGKAWTKRYVRSEKRMAYRRAYEKTWKAIAWRKKYVQSEAFRESQKRYRASLKGKLARSLKDKRYRSSPVFRALRKRLKAQRRAANKHIGALTHAQWLSILRHYKHRCAYCRKKKNQLEQDHYMPLSKGGLHIASNIVPACRSCNAKKQSRHPHKLF